jgi:hypothetical protein
MLIPDRWRQADLAVVIHIVSLTAPLATEAKATAAAVEPRSKASISNVAAGRSGVRGRIEDDPRRFGFHNLHRFA